MFYFLKISAVALMLGAMAQGAMAGETEHFPIVKDSAAVFFGDLDLSRPQDAQIMLERISKAARQACGIMAERDPHYRSNPQFVDSQFCKCRKRAVRDAVANLNKPAVSYAYGKAVGLRSSNGTVASFQDANPAH